MLRTQRFPTIIGMHLKILSQLFATRNCNVGAIAGAFLVFQAAGCSRLTEHSQTKPLYHREMVLEAGDLKVRVRFAFTDRIHDPPPWYGYDSVFDPDGTMPLEVIHSLEAWFRSEAIGVGRGLWADLAQINKIELKQVTAGFLLFIKGGDASTSYAAYLYFDEEGFPVRRRVEESEFPENFFEETTITQVPVYR